MPDTIHIELPLQNMIDLQNNRLYIDDKTGEIISSIGYLDCIKVIQYSYCLRIEFSFPKFLKGNNIYSLEYWEVLEAISLMEKICYSDLSTEEKHQQIEEYKEEIDFDYLKIEINQLLKGIQEGASRTTEIVKGLRIFSRLDEDDLKKADVNEGLNSTLIIVNNLLSDKISLEKNYGEIPLIDCYPGKLNQVFLNIISNAIFAVKEKFKNESGGKISITSNYNSEHVLITIEDNGTGMDEKTRKKIFEPFFTTKNVGEGTGLGMSIVYNTIQKHKGEITVISTPGLGSEFTIELPLTLQ